MSQEMVRSLSGGRCLDWVASNALGASGGILIFWDSRVIQLLEVLESRFSLSYKFKNCQDNFTWIFTGIYGPTKDEYRREMWEDLGAIRGL